MTAPQPSSPDRSGWDETQLIVAEYVNLRAEIIKLTELQFQTTAVTVVAFGTVLSVGIQVGNAAIILIYPMLSLILGVTWLHYANLIARIAAYIRDSIEDRVGHNLGWEHYVQTHSLPRGRFVYWGIRAVFIVSSILALVASPPVANPRIAVAPVLLYVLAVTVTAAVVTVFIICREPSPELSGGQI
jgi:hypothetical protein